MMSIQQISEIVYAQFLAVAVSDLIIYVVICLLSKGLTNLLPGIAALVGQIYLHFCGLIWHIMVTMQHFPQKEQLLFMMYGGDLKS